MHARQNELLFLLHSFTSRLQVFLRNEQFHTDFQIIINWDQVLRQTFLNVAFKRYTNQSRCNVSVFNAFTFKHGKSSVIRYKHNLFLLYFTIKIRYVFINVTHAEVYKKLSLLCRGELPKYHNRHGICM